jgi:hypothetical protein
MGTPATPDSFGKEGTVIHQWAIRDEQPCGGRNVTEYVHLLGKG